MKSPELTTRYSFLHECSMVLRDKLYISGANPAVDEKLLSGLGITHVVNATNRRVPNVLEGGGQVEYLNVDLEDCETEDIAKHFERSNRFVAKALSSSSSGGRVLVHCMCGVSRSASLVLAYLVGERGMSTVIRASPDA